VYQIISSGNDEVPISSRCESLPDTSIVRTYGNLLLEVAACVSDGVVCFFPSYMHLQLVVDSWREQGILDQLKRNKLVFIEEQDASETSLALSNYVEVLKAVFF